MKLPVSWLRERSRTIARPTPSCHNKPLWGKQMRKMCTIFVAALISTTATYYVHNCVYSKAIQSWALGPPSLQTWKPTGNGKWQATTKLSRLHSYVGTCPSTLITQHLTATMSGLFSFYFSVACLLHLSCFTLPRPLATHLLDTFHPPLLNGRRPAPVLFGTMFHINNLLFLNDLGRSGTGLPIAKIPYNFGT